MYNSFIILAVWFGTLVFMLEASEEPMSFSGIFRVYILATVTFGLLERGHLVCWF